MNLRALRVLPAVLLALLPAAGFTAAQAAETPSGLPLPRFVTTRSTPINVRVGPGTKYDVSWIYKVAGTPVEIIQEFDVWRKIRDVDGSEGWVHQNMLSGNRAGYVLPGASVERVALRTSAAAEAGVAAWVGPGFPVKIQSCEAGWCSVQAVDHSGGRAVATYSGYLQDAEIWGVYRGESFD
ncbi:MAG TPA: SH3 domain-containing protein [Devosia sp.]|nr:SH3 domain-containing protein [Devosia sp.]